MSRPERQRRIKSSCLRSPNFLLIVLACIATGCATAEQTAGLAIGLTVAGGQSPTQEIEQIYYLGVFDPQEQLPPQVYRIRVHGQASFISGMSFSSGWVPAQIIDSLNTNIRLDPNAEQDGLSISRGETDTLAQLSPGRRLILFGPEGFREAPANHRLVIVMGSSPAKYFNAIDRVIGAINPPPKTVARLRQQLASELLRIDNQRQRLKKLKAKLVASDEAKQADKSSKADGTPESVPPVNGVVQ